MPQREHKRVRVVDRCLCANTQCRFWLMSLFDGVKHESECSKVDCDNHLQPDEDELPPAPSRPPLWFKDALEST